MSDSEESYESSINSKSIKIVPEDNFISDDQVLTAFHVPEIVGQGEPGLNTKTAVSMSSTLIKENKSQPTTMSAGTSSASSVPIELDNNFKAKVAVDPKIELFEKFNAFFHERNKSIVEEELSNLKTKLTNLEQDKEDLQEQLCAGKEQLSKIQLELATIQKTLINRTDQEKKTLEHKLQKESSNLNTTLIDQKEDLNSKLVEQNRKIKTLENSIDAHLKELNLLKKNNEELKGIETKLADSENAKEMLQNQFSAERDEKLKILEELEKITKEKNLQMAAKDQPSKIQQELVTVQKTLKKTEQEKENLEKKLEKESSALNATLAEKADLNSKLVEQNRKVITLENSIDAHLKELNLLKKKNEELKGLETKLADSENEKEMLQNQLTAEKDINQTILDELEKIAKEKSLLEQKMQKYKTDAKAESIKIQNEKKALEDKLFHEKVEHKACKFMAKSYQDDMKKRIAEDMTLKSKEDENADPLISEEFCDENDQPININPIEPTPSTSANSIVKPNKQLDQEVDSSEEDNIDDEATSFSSELMGECDSRASTATPDNKRRSYGNASGSGGDNENSKRRSSRISEQAKRKRTITEESDDSDSDCSVQSEDEDSEYETTPQLPAKDKPRKARKTTLFSTKAKPRKERKLRVVLTCKFSNCDRKDPFDSEKALQSHVATIHTEHNCPICPYCGKIFLPNQNTTFEEHKNRHEGIKPHKCPNCNYATPYKGNLTSHQRFGSCKKLLKLIL